MNRDAITPKPTVCPDPGLLEQLAEGLLPEPAFSLCFNHIELCSKCEEILEKRMRENALDSHSSWVSSSQTNAAALETERSQPVQHSPAIRNIPKPGQSLPAFGTPVFPGEIGKIDRYRIQMLIYNGAIAFTYLAFDTKLRRQVVVKLLRPSLSKNPEWQAAFLSEARTASQLQSPHIVPILHVDHVGDLTFFVMPCLVGETLASRLKSGPIPSELAARIGLGILEALKTAHNQGVIHRDIKPNNIWLEKTSLLGEPKPILFDFGIASTTNYGIQSTGTKGYHSPEQSQGKSEDPTCDFFSLGCVLFEMVTGKMAFPPHLGIGEISKPLEDPALPKTWLTLIESLIDLDPKNRPKTIEEIARKLTYLAHPPRFPWKWITMAGAAGVLVSLGLVWFSWNANPSNPGIKTDPVKINQTEVAQGKAIMPPYRSHQLASGVSQYPEIQFDSEGNLAINVRNNRAELLDQKGNVISLEIPFQAMKIAWKPPYLAAVDVRGTLAVVEKTPTGTKLLKAYPRPKSSDPLITSLAWSPDPNEPPCLMVGYANRIYTLTLEEGEFPKTLDLRASKLKPTTSSTASQFLWMPYTQFALATMAHGAVKCVQMEDGLEIFRYRPFQQGPPLACFPSDGKSMVLVSPKGKVRLYTMGNHPGQNVVKVDGKAPYLENIREILLGVEVSEAHLLDDSHLVVKIPGETKNPIRIFPLGNQNEPIQFLEDPGEKVESIAVNPAKRQIAALTQSNRVLIYQK